MLVDEQFLTVSQLVVERLSKPEREAPPSAPENQAREIEREAELWSACYARGWACDVANGPFEGDALRRIQRGDLIVLDYHLGPDNDPSASLQLLKQLSESPRSNLVVMYTQDPNLPDVRRRVAATLRGSHKLPSGPQTWDPERVDELAFEALTLPLVDQFLAGDRSYQNDPGVRSMLKQEGFKEVDLEAVIDALLERYLREKLHAPECSRAASLQLSSTAASPLWLQCGNVFVVFVGKDRKGEAVFAELESALVDWNPPPLVASMAYTRHRIAEGGFNLDDSFLRDDPALHAGWLLQVDSWGVPDLIRRTTSQIVENIVEEVASFFRQVLPDQPKNLTHARKHARCPAECTDTQIYLALNSFLCSEPFRGKHLTTGTILREGGSYWICATPACDLIRQPSPPKRPNWSHELRQQKLCPMLVIRASLVPRDKRLAEALTNATKLQHVYFRESDTGQHHALEVLSSIREPSTEQWVAHKLAEVTEGRVDVSIIVANDGGPPTFAMKTLLVVGQLREPYAARLLQAVGQHSSRIGIDFENLPKA